MEGTLSEIRWFAGNFAPRGWFFCQGQLMSIAEYTALFSLVGTTYGGDGQITFGLPDFRSRISVGSGQGPGLSNRVLGEKFGNESVTLLLTNLPSHTHNMTANNNAPTQSTVTNATIASGGAQPNIFNTDNTNLVAMSTNVGIAGSNTPVNIMQPVLGLNFIICAEGFYPSRN